MPDVEALSQTPFFALSAQQTAFTSAKKNEETKKTKKTVFHSLLKNTVREDEFISAGLPAEIAEMSQEEAIVFLEDSLEMAGDALKASRSPETLSKYRTAVQQFIRYIERNNYEITKQKRRGFNRKGRPLEPRIQIRVINQKLDQLAADILSNHSSNLAILNSVDELKGLLVDLLAA